MSAESTTLRGRAAAEANMTGTCRITRNQSDVLDPTTGKYTTPAPSVVFTGICELKFTDTQPRDIDAQAQLLTQQSPVLKVPVVGSEAVTVDDEAEILSNPLDASSVGKKFRIAGIHSQTFATARRFPVEVLS